MPRHIESALRREFNANKESVEDWHVFPYRAQLEHIKDSESQPPPPPLPGIETYPGAGALLSDYIPERWERGVQAFLEMNPQNTPYYPFVTREEYK
jgi:hypothetical protein